MFQINEVYSSNITYQKIIGKLRIVDTIIPITVSLVQIDSKSPSSPFLIEYDKWVELLDRSTVQKIADPYELLPQRQTDLPPGAANKLIIFNKILDTIKDKPNLLSNPKKLYHHILEISTKFEISDRTIQRWIFSWLRYGFNASGIFQKYLDPINDKSKIQKSPVKRGRKSLKIKYTVASSSICEKIEKAVNLYITRQKISVIDAYNEMLIKDLKVPKEYLETSDNTPGILLNQVLIDKYKIPSIWQFRYRYRLIKKVNKGAPQEIPSGKRGHANEGVHGPGFFEIDATYFQIQLVSRFSKLQLVGRPVVYLIVDKYSDCITGYALSLENASWAIASLALLNCFSDKSITFERLGLQYSSADWPANHLPSELIADRAELVSNIGQDFPRSHIKVTITPSGDPKAKGTVEGMHNTLKTTKTGRFELPGRYEKIRKRRQPDGTKSANLDLFEFESIIVEAILDINNDPVKSNRIPSDAVSQGAKVASRIGLYTWAINNRPGFTRVMPEDFIYEHLMINTTATMTPRGIYYEDNYFMCDRIHELGFTTAALEQNFPFKISYHILFGSEVHFRDPILKKWIKASNIDPNIKRLGVSFIEIRQLNADRKDLVKQASLNSNSKGNSRKKTVKKTIKDAASESGRQKALGKLKTNKNTIRANKEWEKSADRRDGIAPYMGTNSGEPRNAPPKKDRLKVNDKLVKVPTKATNGKTKNDQIGKKGDDDRDSYWDDVRDTSR